MIRDRLERIRERAYALWERAGGGHGHDETHWHLASREIDDEDLVLSTPSDASGPASRGRKSAGPAHGKTSRASQPAERRRGKAASVVVAAPSDSDAPGAAPTSHSRKTGAVKSRTNALQSETAKAATKARPLPKTPKAAQPKAGSGKTVTPPVDAPTKAGRARSGDRTT